MSSAFFSDKTIYEKATQLASINGEVSCTLRKVQQCLNAGLLDEIHIDLVPFLLGDGIRLFEHLKVAPVALEDPHVSIGKGVVRLTYPVKK